jgi:orotidine-5'-phosphate decarboxylase
MNYNPIILALDYDNLNEADAMLSKTRPHIGMIKVGLELFSSCGREALSLSRHYNIPLFLDLKLLDVPTTIRKTMDGLMGSLVSLPGNHFFSIHCFGGREMCKTALEITKGTNVKPVGITLLTSFDSGDVGDLGFNNSNLGTRAVKITRLGMGCIDPGKPAYPGHPGYPGYANYPPVPATPAIPPVGLDTFVCAPAQLPLMRKHYKNEITLISPGIRFDTMEPNDHKAAKPASFALKNGANWLVIGRPITQAHDPVAMAQAFEKIADKY